MTTEARAGGVLAALSNELAGVVERASQSVVTMHGRRRFPASGIVWPVSGGPGIIVVTADHVLERDEDLSVTLADGKQVAATLVGRDPGSDVAVLRVSGATATAAELAPAESARVGHLVLALGRPGSGAPLASFGVISAIGGASRTARGGMVEGYIRPDLVFYPGFSGGPLVDAQGRIVGLNSSHIARGQEVALPAQAVSAIVQTLLSQGRIRRGFLGISSQPVQLPAALRQKLDLDQETGLMIIRVEPGSPAEQGGLLMGDVLVALAGQPVVDAEDLQAALGPGAVGKPMSAVVARGGERRELTVTPGERAE